METPNETKRERKRETNETPRETKEQLGELCTPVAPRSKSREVETYRRRISWESFAPQLILSLKGRDGDAERNETRKIRETNETPATRKGCSEDLRERRRDVSAQKKRNLLVVEKYEVVLVVLIPVWNAIF